MSGNSFCVVELIELEIDVSRLGVVQGGSRKDEETWLVGFFMRRLDVVWHNSGLGGLSF